MTKVFSPIVGFEDQWDFRKTSSTLSIKSDEEYPTTSHYLALQEMGMMGVITHLRSNYKDKRDFAFFSQFFEMLWVHIFDR